MGSADLAGCWLRLLRGGRRLETRRRAPKSPRRGLLDRWTKGSRAVPGSAAEADREKAEANEEETLHRIYLVGTMQA